MSCGCFHAENRFSGMLNKLIENSFLIVKSFVIELSKCSHTDNIAIGTHDRNGFQYMFRFFTVHNHATFGFKFPGTLIDVEHHGVHSKVHAGFLSTQAGAQA